MNTFLHISITKLLITMKLKGTVRLNFRNFWISTARHIIRLEITAELPKIKNQSLNQTSLVLYRHSINWQSVIYIYSVSRHWVYRHSVHRHSWTRYSVTKAYSVALPSPSAPRVRESVFAMFCFSLQNCNDLNDNMSHTAILCFASLIRWKAQIIVSVTCKWQGCHTSKLLLEHLFTFR